MTGGPNDSLPGTEANSPRTRDLDAWDTPTGLAALWEAQLAAVASVRPALPALGRAVDAAASRLASGGRLAYAGAGTSGRIGVQDGAELPPTFDWPESRLVLLIAGGEPALLRAVENAEDDEQAGRDAVRAHGIGDADVLVAVAASGATPYTIACLQEARRRGALTIAVANSPGAKLLDAAEHPVLADTGAEPLAGSTRLKAGTAQKVLLNLFSTQLMVRLNRVYAGRMVDMQARNDKLRRRAVRMVQDLTGCAASEAQSALDAAGGKVKLAVLVAGGRSPAAAQALLDAHHGDLRRSLGPAAAPA